MFKAKPVSELVNELEKERTQKILELENKKNKKSMMEVKHRTRSVVQRPSKKNRSNRTPSNSTHTTYEVNKKAIARWDQIIQREQARYDEKISKIKSHPRAPVYILESIVEPNWEDAATVVSKTQYRIVFSQKFENQAFWKKIKLNHTPKQAKSILGKPSETKVSVGQTIFIYSEKDLTGFLVFEADDKGVERLTMWVEPLWLKRFFDVIPDPPKDLNIKNKEENEAEDDGNKTFCPYEVPSPLV